MYEKLVKHYPNGFVHGIIAGHGGLIDGKYSIQKPGSKQTTFDDGLTIYEGVENRKIKDMAIEQGNYEGIKFIDIIPGNYDVPLRERINTVNNYHNLLKQEGKLLLVWEIHLNAFSNRKVSGKEVYTTRKQNFSDEMATIWWNQAEKIFPEQKDRPDYSDGDVDKEVDYYIIKNINTFGTLMEMFFFTNREEVDKYCNPIGYKNWAYTIISAALELNQKFYIQKNK